jgi:hypothetical protein
MPPPFYNNEAEDLGKQRRGGGIEPPTWREHARSRGGNAVAKFKNRRIGCVGPLHALASWAGQRHIFCLSPDANGPGQTICVIGLHQPAGGASPIGRRIASAAVRSGPIGPRVTCALPSSESGPTRPARPILSPNLGRVCIGLDSARVLPHPPWALPPAAEN